MRAPKFITNLKRIVQIAHRGQEYGNGKDYFSYHILGVVAETKAILEARGFTSNDPFYWECIGVAFGHDVVEDTGVNLGYLRLKDVPENIVVGINCITKNIDEDGQVYLEKVLRYESSHLVKQADSSFNLQNSIREGATRRIKKYTKYLSKLA